MLVKPSILPGTMELLPHEQLIFNKMKDIIRETYELFSFFTYRYACFGED